MTDGRTMVIAEHKGVTQKPRTLVYGDWSLAADAEGDLDAAIDFLDQVASRDAPKTARGPGSAQATCRRLQPVRSSASRP